MAFKDDFLWGSASAAYQIEGAYLSAGKGLSIWDEWTHRPGRAYNGDLACDHYNRFLEDVALMKEMGLKTYRFSISWPRIIPKGTGKLNLEGVEFYNRLIDALVDANIVPMVTLYHWDLPLELEKRYGGWANEQIVADFEAYALICFDLFSDRVKHWIVMNEPNIFTGLGYEVGLHPPGIQNKAMYLQAFHYTALAHARSVIAFKEGGYEGIIGSSIAYSPSYAASEKKEDLEAKEMYDACGPDWFIDSYYKGEYPELASSYYASIDVMPKVSSEEMALLKKAAKLCDFIGINYYQTSLIAHNPIDGVGFSGINTSGKKGTQSESGVKGLYKHIRNEGLKYTDWDWAIDPEGLQMGLELLHEKYGLPIIISENGLGAYDEMDEFGKINDDYRIEFLKYHILAAERAVENGVSLLAYCTWSFTDLLSWLNGYKKRYGFVYVDIENGTLNRSKKQSFEWYKKVIESNGRVL